MEHKSINKEHAQGLAVCGHYHLIETYFHVRVRQRFSSCLIGYLAEFAATLWHHRCIITINYFIKTILLIF